MFIISIFVSCEFCDFECTHTQMNVAEEDGLGLQIIEIFSYTIIPLQY